MASSSGIIPRLSPGLVSIYGTASIYGFYGYQPELSFGVINTMSSNISGSFSVGQNVLLPYKEAYKISYGNTDYWIISEDKIILVEQEPEELS